MLQNSCCKYCGRIGGLFEVELFSKTTKKTDIVFKNIHNLDITTGASNDLNKRIVLHEDTFRYLDCPMTI